MTTLRLETELRLRMRVAARQARELMRTPTVQAYYRGAFDPFRSEINGTNARCGLRTDLLAGYRERFREALGLRERLQPWVQKFADRATSWWLKPKQVTGLEEHLESHRRRTIDVDASVNARMRALLQRCNRSANSPGQDVVTHPQVTEARTPAGPLVIPDLRGLRRA
ncbi:hypothetical protein GS881_24390 [Rhodococcus hoagii]|nr:hypothetical protein [Prescottella equi]